MASHNGGHDGSHYVDLGPIIKSPLDPNQYKIIQLCKNGLRAFLISTIGCPPNPKNAKLDPTTCAYEAVQEFNSKYLGIPRDPQTTRACTRKRSKSKNSCGKTNCPAPCRKLSDCTPSDWRTEVKKDLKNVTCTPFCSAQTQFLAQKKNKRCAVTLTVGSGNAQDPLDMNGLAHLVEHCLYLGGSRKYPHKGYFHEFCLTNGGRSNAATTTETTYYMFEINQDKLSEGLEIFTDFITAPLFLDDRIQGEIDSVDSEFRIRKLSDDLRYQTLIQSFAEEGHPMGNFECGNRESLSLPHLGQRIKEWKEVHYNGKNMVLTIQAEMSIEDLVQLVVQHFSSLPPCFCPQGYERKRLVDKYASCGGPFDPCKWNRIYRIKPIANENKLRFTWVLPAKAHLNYKTKVNQFLAYLLTRKVPGSLDCYLRQKGWLQKICGPGPCLLWEHYMQSHFCTIYTYIISLTPLGMEDYPQVCLAVHSYIRMIRDSKAEELNRIFEELKRMSADTFHYCSDGYIMNPTNNFYFNPKVYDIYVLHKFNEVILNDVDPKEVLLSKMVITEYNDALIRECLDLMQPGKCNFILESKDLIVDCGNFEEWFGVEYCEEGLTDDFLTKLQTVKIYPEFYLPPPNEFMQTSLCFPTDPREKLEYKDDLVVLDDDKVCMTYSNSDCQKGLLPSAYYSMELSSSETADTTLPHVNPYMLLWETCIEYLLEVKLAQALSSLISVYVRVENAYNLRIILRGPSGRLPQLFDTVIATVIEFENELTGQVFDNMKCMLKDSYENSTIDAIYLATGLMDYVVQQRYTSAGSTAKIIEETTLEDLVDFVETYKARMFVKIDLSGCVSKSEALNVSKSVKLMEHYSWKRDPDLVVLNRGVQLPLGERCLRVRARNSEENNHLILNNYQFGISTKQKRLIANAITIPMASRAFQYLRTELNLGYIVAVYLDAYHSIFALIIVVNPFTNNFTPDYVDERIDDFLALFYKEFVNNKDKYKDNIGNYFCKEDGIKWEDVKEFYGMYLLPKGAQFRKLTVQVVGTQDNCRKGKPRGGSLTQRNIERYSSGVKLVDLPEETFELDLPKACKEENGYFITDVYSFKSQQPCYPNLVDFAHLPGNP